MNDGAILRFIKRVKTWLPSSQQLLYSTTLFSKKERRIIATCLTLITVSSIWISVNQLNTHLALAPQTGGTYREGLIGQPTYLNPLLAQTSAIDTDLTRLLFSGLFRYNAALKPVPDLADTISMDNEKTYTITIKQTAIWHDGEPVTIDDVVFTFERLTDPALRSPLAQTLQGVVVERVDDKTIRFTLPEPYPAFLEILTVGIIPKHIWEEIPTDQVRQSDFNSRPIGSGPWQFSSLAKDSDGTTRSYSFVPTENTNQSGYIERLTFKFYPDETSALDALQSRTVDGLAMIANSDAELLAKTSRGFNRYDMQLPAITAVFFNTSQKGPLADGRVREALNLAIDRRALVLSTIVGEANVSRGPFPTNVMGTKQAADTGTVERTQAAALLDSAGWKVNDTLRSDRQGTPLSVTLTAIDRQPDRDVAQFIQQSWRTIGVDVKINIIAPATADHVRDTVLRPRAYDALLYTIVYAATVDPYPFWHSSQKNDPGLNLSLFENADADTLIDRIRRSEDTAAREELFTALRKIISDETPAIFLYSPIRQYLISHEIHGVSIPKLAIPADRFTTLNTWYIETKRAFSR
ncbi:MAG: peptide ABC transporter substrate-binding protein [Patescibacteria group bacterium]